MNESPLFHHIRRATHDDVNACDIIARTCEKLARGSLGWVRKDGLHRSVDKQSLHVAVWQGRVIGFVDFSTPSRGVNKGWNVIHALAVHPDSRIQGVGRALLYSVPTPIRLKCPEFVNKDQRNIANDFYKCAGMTLKGSSATRQTNRKLNVWEMKVLAILVQGNNKRMPEIAHKSGWAYGTRAIEKPRAYPVQVDIEWKKYVWADYLAKIEAWRPVAALVADYLTPEQKPVMLQQIQDLRDLGVIRVMCCPKFAGACYDIPKDVIIAVSVPSTYAGYVPADKELAGRKLHLLGGSPPKWFGSRGNGDPTGYIAKFEGIGAQVISVDGNAHTRAATQGMIWSNGAWGVNRDKSLPLDIYQVMIASGQNIRSQLHSIEGLKQPMLEGW